MNISQNAQGGNNNDLSLTQQHNLFHGVLASKRPPPPLPSPPFPVHTHTHNCNPTYVETILSVWTGWDKANLRPTRWCPPIASGSSHHSHGFITRQQYR